ncbi:MAG: peptidase S10 [Verrucomicrobia bacterium]|nr:peptidase S10 [Verrucomicrobiota bacterium]
MRCRLCPDVPILARFTSPASTDVSSRLRFLHVSPQSAPGRARVGHPLQRLAVTKVCAWKLCAALSLLWSSLQAQQPATPGPASASPRPTPAAVAKESPTSDKKQDFQTSPPIVTGHELALPDGKVLHYKAITGYLLLRDHNDEPAAPSPGASASARPQQEVDPARGRPKAQVFFVAYVLDSGVDAASRPVTFAFNGGPGSASIWLHMGAFGPRRVQLSERGEALPGPAKLVDNESTWLDRTDLVFVDPVSTGYSRPAPGENPSQFHGYREDVRNIGDFIRLWITRYDRWGSPKFIAGESYGTTRAAGLSNYLQDRYGLYVNGLVLIGPALSLQALDFTPGNDEPYPLYLPTYTAAAWYHRRLGPELQQKPLTEVLAEAERFAAGDYAAALRAGDTITPELRRRVKDELARLTGLEADYLERINFRESDEAFLLDLLKPENRIVGRLDTRYTGIRVQPNSARAEYDPAAEAVNGPFTSGFYQYARRELKYESDLPYETAADVRPWLYSVDRYLNVVGELKTAMSKNPYLKVLVCSGYYDLATPYFASEYVLHTMGLDPAIRRNLRSAFYESGHMLYVEGAARVKFKADFEAWLTYALNAPLVPNAQRPSQ